MDNGRICLSVITPSFHLSIIGKVLLSRPSTDAFLTFWTFLFSSWFKSILTTAKTRHSNDDGDTDRSIPRLTPPLNRMSAAEPIQSLLKFHLRPGFCPCFLREIVSSPLLPFPFPLLYYYHLWMHCTLRLEFLVVFCDCFVSSFLLLISFPCLTRVTFLRVQLTRGLECGVPHTCIKHGR